MTLPITLPMTMTLPTITTMTMATAVRPTLVVRRAAGGVGAAAAVRQEAAAAHAADLDVDTTTLIITTTTTTTITTIIIIITTTIITTTTIGRVEASFASKLVATLDPSKPVIDKFVLKNFALRLPRRGSPDRENKTVDLYHDLCGKYSDFIQSQTGVMIRELFDRRHPGSGISELKKIDLVLWQIRA
jgi:hypothetical protein